MRRSGGGGVGGSKLSTSLSKLYLQQKAGGRENCLVAIQVYSSDFCQVSFRPRTLPNIISRLSQTLMGVDEMSTKLQCLLSEKVGVENWDIHA